ncbi:MAG: hypothetical protein NTX25_05170 [Proteobacteria bacterium]|nr:hypothetical protein [Pseudomonadota bacterium]
MTAKNLQNLKFELEATGFVQKTDQSFVWTPDQAMGLERKQLPWQIKEWIVEIKGQELQQISFETQLHQESLLKNCEEILQERFTSFRRAALQEDQQTGFWLLFEFLDKVLDGDQSRLIEEEELYRSQLPHGLAGLHITVIQALGQVSVFMTRHFILGNVPGQLLIEFPRVLTQALFGLELKNEANFSAYISTIGAEDIRRTILRSLTFTGDLQRQLQPQLSHGPLPFLQVALQAKDKAWSLTWNQKQELPELVVPPIEVLEQREVARRFQKLDELILLEDYPAAVEQCREYLQRFPQSLYLIRRWAFLSLWASVSIEKIYLDLMTKYDPNNLMTLSLWVRKSFQDHEPEPLLEYLSRLGNSLSQTISDFGKIDITSLTLPEMLGDAWNQKDDQRAVACYDRVLQTRGEVPRILVKLIRLMRDIDDEAAEESYMDRLLACEVPTRTRAAIYYRIAEIKQVEDQKEAVQWALKSWQTNRNQVKYALLASDLLISLFRAHEAVHVLVDTSEILPDDEPVSSRLELELKIAGIWLTDLQRYDLALERLERARDLVGEDLDGLERILPLAEKLGVSDFYLDILMQTLKIAGKDENSSRVEHLVKALLVVADKTEDKAQLTNIYSLVLKMTLLDVKLIEGMSSRLDYERAMASGHLNEVAFNFLDELYARLGLNRQRYELLKNRLAEASLADQKLILRELYYFDDDVADDEKDRFAIEIFRLDHDDLGPLEERIVNYESQGNAQGIHQLIEQAVDATERLVLIAPLLQSGWQALQTMHSENRFRYIDQIFQYLQTLDPDPLEHALTALSCLWSDPAKAYVKPFLEQVLGAGELPDLDPQQMLDVLDDGELKIKLLLRLAHATIDPMRALSYERRAFQIVRTIPGLLGLRMEIVQRLSERTPLQDEELTEYAKVVWQTGKSQSIIRLLAQQIPVTQSEVIRDKLFHLSCEYLGRAASDTLDLQQMQKAIYRLGPDQKNRLKTIWLERIGFDEQMHPKEFAVQMLRDKKFWEYREATSILLKQLIEVWQELPLVKGLVMPILQSMMEEDREQDLRFYLNLLLPSGLLSQSTSLAAFEYFANHRDSILMERYWLHSLGQMESGEQTRRLLEYSKDLLQEIGLLAFLYDTIAGLIGSNKQDRIISEVQRELRIFYAEYLYTSAKDNRQALLLYELAYAANNADVRTWGPMIVLYREFQADTDLYELLHRILPSLRKDSEPLHRFNLELDLLEQDLLTIGERLDLKPELPEIDASYTLADELQFSSETSAGQILGPSGTSVKSSNSQLDLPTKAQLLPSLNLGQMGNLDAENLLDESEAASQSANPGESYEKFNQQNEDIHFSRLIYNAGSSPLNTVVAKIPSIESLTKPPELPFHNQGATHPKHEASLSSDLFKLSDESSSELAGSLQASSDHELHELSAPQDIKDSQSDFNEDHRNHSTSLAVLPELPQLPGNVTLISTDNSSDPMLGPSKTVISSTEYSSELGAAAQGSHERNSKSFEAGDWRIVASQGKASERLCQWLLDNPLPSKTEQHMALQVTAVFQESLPLLNRWPHKVWRNSADYFYDLRWTDRMGREMFHPGVKSPLARLLKTVSPLVIRNFASHMNWKAISERLKMKPEDLIRNRRLLDWKDEVIQRTGLRYYVKFLTENKYQIFHLAKLEDRFQFDLEKNEIYIDREYYITAPPTHLFHRLAFLIRAVSLDYYPMLNLSPANDLFPFLMKVRRSLEQNRMDSVKRIFGMEKDGFKLMLSQADREGLEQLFVEVGSLSPDKITKIVGVYVDQIYRVNLAESLDLIGLMESISNINLLDDNVSSLSVVNQSAAIRSLISFAAELKFELKT